MTKRVDEIARAALPLVERIAGDSIKRMQRIRRKGPLALRDIGDHRGHESNSLDPLMRGIVEKQLFAAMPDFRGLLFFESEPYHYKPEEPDAEGKASKQGIIKIAIIDELEGTTNGKRCLTSPIDYLPRSGVSIALCTSYTLDGLLVGAFATFHGLVFSFMRVGANGDDGFMTFVNGRRLDPIVIQPIRGDSKKRVIVTGYSNSHRIKKGQLEQALWDAGFKVYDGCRASGVDICDLISGQTDAYIDLRAFWSTMKGLREMEAQLQVYDCAASIGNALGTGMGIFAPGPRPWQEYRYDQAIPLVLCRRALQADLEGVINPLAEKWLAELAPEHPLRTGKPSH